MLRLGRRVRRPALVTLVTRQGCHQCELDLPVVQRAAREAGVAFELRDVDSDDGWRAEWGAKVPVVLIDGVEHGFWAVDEQRLRQALRG